MTRPYNQGWVALVATLYWERGIAAGAFSGAAVTAAAFLLLHVLGVV